jgi:hypothetical protein
MASILQVANPFGEEVILSEDVWEDIILKHPEVKSFLKEIGDTIAKPDFVKESVYDSRSKLYYLFHKHIYNGKYLVIVVKTVDINFVSTIYLTNNPIKKGRVIWMKE